jgi:hypothetical protein
LLEERTPTALSAHWNARPLAEAVPVGRERFCFAGVNERRRGVFVEFDDEVAGAVIAAGEEVAVEAEAGKAHHRRAGDAGLLQERLRECPESLFAARVLTVVHEGLRSFEAGTRS